MKAHIFYENTIDHRSKLQDVLEIFPAIPAEILLFTIQRISVLD